MGDWQAEWDWSEEIGKLLDGVYVAGDWSVVMENHGSDVVALLDGKESGRLAGWSDDDAPDDEDSARWEMVPDGSSPRTQNHRV